MPQKDCLSEGQNAGEGLSEIQQERQVLNISRGCNAAFRTFQTILRFICAVVFIVCEPFLSLSSSPNHMVFITSVV